MEQSASIYLLPGIAKPKPETAARLLCDRLHYDFNQLRSNKTRRRDIVEKRQIIMYLMRNLGYTLHLIGRVFFKDHATVLHAKKAVENRMFWDKDFEYFIVTQKQLEL